MRERTTVKMRTMRRRRKRRKRRRKRRRRRTWEMDSGKL
jgi:hypothetical protein